MIALILRKQNRTDEAIEQYRKVLSLDPEAAVAANNLAWIYADQGRMLEEGLRLARIARTKLPSQPEVIDTIGWLYYKSRQPDLAVPYFKEAIDLSPRNPQYRYHLAATYARTGASRLAKATLEEALKLGSNFPEIEDARRLLVRLR
jgi:tetratricopeptide (TPR) repeat protein